MSNITIQLKFFFKFLLHSLLIFLVCSNHQSLSQIRSSGDPKPNIIIIMADDLGYGDLGGYFGGQAHTPNIDKLAQEGMLFTDFHSNGPMCSPTRAALLTGRYQQRLGIETALPTDWSDMGIGSKENNHEKTIAEYLREDGFQTAIYGKWHLGKAAEANPVLHGFNDFKGLTCGSGDYFSKMDRNGFRDWWHNDNLEFQEGYATNVILDNSIDFIKENSNNPFFLYVAFSAIHFPWQTAEDYNLETVREGEDYSSIYPGPQSKLGPHKPEAIPAVVVKMIEELDMGVGAIMNTLQNLHIKENTVVFFTSDNGGYLRYARDVWPKVGSNGILRGQKGMLYEGGHRVPTIVSWPGKIPALSLCDKTALSFDILPTIMSILNISEPLGSNVLDGKSLLPILINNSSIEPRKLFWRTPDAKAVRDEEWKLVISEDHKIELFDLHSDIGESNDLSGKYPEKVDSLMSALLEWEKDVDNKKMNK